MSDPNKHHVFFTDFGSILDLMGAEKDNSSVNNHAVIDIFLLYIVGCESVNIVWSDNCLGQYRCQQNFLNVTKAVENHGNETIIVHKLAEKYRFKGSWDATGKIVKERIMNNELKYNRCANAMDCYLKITQDLTKMGTKAIC